MSEREWRFYLDDMIKFAQNVLSYIAEMDQNKFIDSKLNI